MPRLWTPNAGFGGYAAPAYPWDKWDSALKYPDKASFGYATVNAYGLLEDAFHRQPRFVRLKGHPVVFADARHHEQARGGKTRLGPQRRGSIGSVRARPRRCLGEPHAGR